MGEFKVYDRTVRRRRVNADAYVRFGISRVTIGFSKAVAEELIDRLGGWFTVGADVEGGRLALIPDYDGYKIAPHNSDVSMWMWVTSAANDDLLTMFGAQMNDGRAYPMEIEIREKDAILTMPAKK